ncbi:MAG: thiamine pyrophosphate-binding protein, partial [Oligoflexales bacterium]|nr:thiamine pyrophosphate-binding protein [Oligoflexales bacterium]
MNLSDYVVNTLYEHGIKEIFLLPGGGCMYLVDSVGRHDRMKFVCNLHEQASAIAAEAYAQYTNNLGACLVTTGPGGTNAVTGVAGAYLDSTPCIFISGQVKRADLKRTPEQRQMGPQEIDIINIVKSITKYAVTVTDPSEIRFHMEKAIFLAKSGRPGPVWIDIPLDVQFADIDVANLRGFYFDGPKAPSIDPGIMDEIIYLLNNAKRPAILAGNGIRLSKSGEMFRSMANKMGIPVLCTWKTIDFFSEDDPLYCGRPGAIGQRGANLIQQNADFLMCIGARLDTGQTAFNIQKFGEKAQKVIVDIDGEELSKFKETSALLVQADASDFLSALFTRLSDIANPKAWQPWLVRAKNVYKKYPVIEKEAQRKDQNVIDLYALMDVLSDLLNENDLIVPGSSGTCSEVFLQAFRIKHGQRALNTPSLGSMGFGLPASIGACVASGKRRTICINGDGGLMHNIQELETLKRLCLPIKLFVLNNNGYGSIVATQKSFFNGRLIASHPDGGLTIPSFQSLAN